MRLPILAVSLVAACAPAQKAAPPRTPVQAAAAPTPAPPPLPRCGYSVRRLSAGGRGAVRPQLAAGADAFAVAWEETIDHRSIRVQTFAPDGQPLGPSIEVADVARAAAAPRLAASPDGDGFAIFWSAEHGDGSSALTMRRIDRTGKPKSDPIPVVVAPGVRALAAAPTDSGYALAWWNWSGTPHQLSVSYVDKEGRAAGRPVPITRAPAPDPTVDFAPGALALAWDETVAGIDHVVTAELGKEHRLDGRVDLGPGETPRIGGGLVVWERPAEAAIWSAPLAGGGPVRVTDGHMPAAATRHLGVSALCFLRDTAPSKETHVDELVCGTLALGGQLYEPTRIAAAPRAIFGLEVAVAGGRTGVAWQSQEEDDSAVSFAAVSCADVGVATPRT